VPITNQKSIVLTKATIFVDAKTIINKNKSDGKGSFGSQTLYQPTVVREDNYKLNPSTPSRFAFKGIPFKYNEPFRCPYYYTEQVIKNKIA
jgi:hypothetical protein